MMPAHRGSTCCSPCAGNADAQFRVARIYIAQQGRGAERVGGMQLVGNCRQRW